MEDIQREGWTKYYDKEYNSYYLYNETTGESVWEVDFNHQDIQLQTSPLKESTGLHNRISESSEEDIIVEKKSKTFRSKDFPRNDPPLTPAEQTQYDIACYARFIFVHAALIEAPFTILEGIFRVIFILSICIIRLIYFSCRQKWKKCMKTIQLYTREIILTIAVIISLSIPGLICSIYWRYSSETDWELQPIITIFGYVDMRRFGVITYGSAATASNVSNITDTDDNNIEDKESLVNRTILPKTTSTKSSSGRSSNSKQISTIRIDRNNQDSWKGSLIYVPKEIITDIKMFLSGSNKLESMDIVL